MLAGCSQTTSIPRNDLDNPKYQKSSSYRVRVRDETVYLVRTFAVTDTTLLISELSPHSSPNAKHDMPIVLPLAEVESVENVEARTWPLYAFGFVVALLVVGYFVLQDDAVDIPQ